MMTQAVFFLGGLSLWVLVRMMINPFPEVLRRLFWVGIMLSFGGANLVGMGQQPLFLNFIWPGLLGMIVSEFLWKWLSQWLLPKPENK